MPRTPLQEFLKTTTQSELGRRVGLTQGAIWQMIYNKRVIFVVEHPDGTLTLEEVKRIGREPSVDSAA